MLNLSPAECNNEAYSHPAFWYLREIQSDVVAPPSKRNSHFGTTRLRHGEDLVSLLPAALHHIQSFSLVAALDSLKSTSVHLFYGRQLEHVLTIDSANGQLSSLAHAGSDLLLLDLERRGIYFISLLLLQSRWEHLLSETDRPKVEPLQKLFPSFAKFPSRANLEQGVRIYAWKANAEAINCILWTPGTDQAYRVTRQREELSLTKVDLALGPFQSSPIAMQGITYSNLMDALYIADSAGGRIIEVRSLTRQIGPKGIAGDGTLGYRAGSAASSRLGPISDVVAYSISPDSRARLSNVLSQDKLSPYWSSPANESRRGGGRGASEVHRALESAQFLVGVDPSINLAFTVSYPRRGQLKRLAEIHRDARVLPLIGPRGWELETQQHLGVTSASHGLASSPFTRVTTAPDSSLLFWSPQSPDILVLDPCIELYCQDWEQSASFQARRKMQLPIS